MKRIAGQQDELGAHGCLVLREIRPDRVGGRRDDAELAARYAKLKEMETKLEGRVQNLHERATVHGGRGLWPPGLLREVLCVVARQE